MPIDKGDGTKRPLVIPSIEIRIIQRSILQILEKEPIIEQTYLANDFSYGGIKGKGTHEAVNRLFELFKNGALYYFKCDIESFFTKIPFNIVVDKLNEHLKAEDFVSLVRKVTLLEIFSTVHF